MVQAISCRPFTQRSGFETYVRFVVDKATLGWDFPPLLRFPLSASFYRRSTPIFRLELIVSGEKAALVCEPPNKGTLLHDSTIPPRSS